MIRPFTILCMLLAAASGLYLYQEKHRASVLERQIAQVVKAADAARERTGLLRAEWTVLNEPDRLKALATRYLTQLQQMAPAQFVQMAALDSRLPAVPQPPAPPTADDAEDAVVANATPFPPPVPAAPPPAIATAAASPGADPAAASPAPEVRVADAEISAPVRAAKPVPVRESPARRKPAVADAAFQTAPSAEPRPLRTRRVMAPIVEAYATARPVQINRRVAVQRAAAVTPAAPPVMTGSVLGGGRPLLAPPVPFGGSGGGR